MASCALPILFQPVKIGNHYYLDGGLADSIPYKRAMEAGCDKNIVVLTRERNYVKKPDKATKASSWLYQRYPKVVEDLKLRAKRYNACMRELLQLEKEGKVFLIVPDDLHGVGRTENDPKRLELLYEEGYLKAKEQMTALRNYLNA